MHNWCFIYLNDSLSTWFQGIYIILRCPYLKIGLSITFSFMTTLLLGFFFSQRRDGWIQVLYILPPEGDDSGPVIIASANQLWFIATLWHHSHSYHFWKIGNPWNYIIQQWGIWSFTERMRIKNIQSTPESSKSPMFGRTLSRAVFEVYERQSFTCSCENFQCWHSLCTYLRFSMCAKPSGIEITPIFLHLYFSIARTPHAVHFFTIKRNNK